MIRLVGLVLLAGCLRDPSRDAVDFGAAFEACDADAIRFLAGKHNFAPAFEPCGSNNFQAASWSPDGRHLLFELSTGAFVLDASSPDKPTAPIPVEDPTAPGAWTSPTRLVLPIGPAQGETTPRLAVYDLGTAAVTWVPLPGLADPMDLTAGEDPSVVLLTAASDRRRIVAVDLDRGTVSDPFPWTADLPVERFSYQPAQDAVVISAAGTTRLYDMVGTLLGEWSPAARGTLHPGGRWLALEHQGPPAPLFGQHTWDDQSTARTRERSREEIEKDLPDWAPRTVEPPAITLVDRATGQRWAFTGFQGTGFQWYEARDYYASLILWGFEGSETNRNVVLGDLADRMEYAERGEELMGVERFRAEAP